MKSIFRPVRRHKPQPKSEVESETPAPFFSKEATSPLAVQQKSGAFFQPKLSIGQPDDQYEREADAVADKVVGGQTGGNIRQTASSVQRLSTPEEEKMPATNDGRMAEDKRIQEKPDVQRAEAPAKEEEKPAVQKMEAPDKEEEKPVQKMEAPDKQEEEKPAVQKMETPDKEEEKPVQKMEAPDKQEEEKPAVQKMDASEKEKEGDAPVQAKSEPGGGQKASPQLSGRIESSRGRGNKLPDGTRAQMETSFGRDFSDVTVHTDSASIEMNRELGAQAFTNGSDVYFGSGKYQPDSSEGKRLLAHELTHVVQQGGGQNSARISPYRDDSTTHFGKRDMGDLKEEEFDNKKDKATKPWVKDINIHFDFEKKDESGLLIPVGIATATYGASTNALPPVSIGVTGGSKKRGQTRPGNFTVTRIEGLGYNDLPLAAGVGPNKKYAAPPNFTASMHYAIFFDGGRALHSGAYDDSSHGCVHVDHVDFLQQINYHSIVGLTKVNVTFAPNLVMAIKTGNSSDPTKTKTIADFEAALKSGNHTEAALQVKKLAESDQRALLMTTKQTDLVSLYENAVKGTALDTFDALGNITRSAYLDKMWLTASSITTLVEHLNAFSTDDIKLRLIRFTKAQRDQIHDSAVKNPKLGPSSQIAQLTTP
jgi:hypothetical protein